MVKVYCSYSSIFFLMIRRPPRATQCRSSAASDVYKRQVASLSDVPACDCQVRSCRTARGSAQVVALERGCAKAISSSLKPLVRLSLIHISEPTRLLSISYAVFCLKKKNTINKSAQSIAVHLTLNKYQIIYIGITKVDY